MSPLPGDPSTTRRFDDGLAVDLPYAASDNAGFILRVDRVPTCSHVIAMTPERVGWLLHVLDHHGILAKHGYRAGLPDDPPVARVTVENLRKLLAALEGAWWLTAAEAYADLKQQLDSPPGGAA